MAKLLRRSETRKEKVYDVTVRDTNSFFTYSKHGSHNDAILVHNCHRLSIQAMDGLLKSLEDNVPGTDDKILVCIFCTTEPEKVRGTISSRCAPTFVVRKAAPDKVADRCAEICGQEEIPYDKEALVLIAEATECHIRDALQAVSGVSVLGEVSLENVHGYLCLGASSCYLKILGNIGSDLRVVIESVDELKALVSPSTCYVKLAEIAMQIYKSRSVKVGTLPGYWPSELLTPFEGSRLRNLVAVAHWLSQRPGRATQAMLLCDISTLHHRLVDGVALTSKESFVVVTTTGSPSAPAPATVPVATPSGDAKEVEEVVAPSPPKPSGPPVVQADGRVTTSDEPGLSFGVHIDPSHQPKPKETKSDEDHYPLETARKILFERLEDLGGRRSPG